jgi:hypothetical protein
VAQTSEGQEAIQRPDISKDPGSLFCIKKHTTRLAGLTERRQYYWVLVLRLDLELGDAKMLGYMRSHLRENANKNGGYARELCVHSPCSS